MMILKAGPRPLADLEEFLAPFAGMFTRRENRSAMERYATGLLADVKRKTAHGMGREVAETNGLRLQEFLTNTKWEPREMDRLRAQRMVRDATVGEGVIVIDDTGLPKKGRHSVGVARQYSGTLGRVDNCQVVVTAHYADRRFDWPITSQLYLPESWTEDAERRAKAKVPPELSYQTKNEIALDLIDWAIEAGVPARAVVIDAGYGQSPTFLDGLEKRGLPYVAAVKSTTRFRAADSVEADSGELEAAPKTGKRGRPRKAKDLADRVADHEAQELIDALDDAAWQKVVWREGRKGLLAKRAAALRVYRAGPRGAHTPSCGWLIAERPRSSDEDPKYYFAWGFEAPDLAALVELGHIRWVIERFYQDAKGELGLDDYEGRLWTGLHRHLALVMLCHSFLTLRQSYDRVDDSVARAGATSASMGQPDLPGRGFPP